MVDTMSTLLKPWPKADDRTEPIITTLARINHERGSFRDLTTESLQAEAATEAQHESTTSAEVAEAISKDAEDTAQSKSRIEALQRAKAELQGHIATAQNEALMALDFVSLLISKDMPRQADQTMSPFLKQQVKPGTLGLDMWQNMPPDRARESTDATIAKGWRMKMLHQSADSLLDAATRLQADVKKETEYWTQVLHISDSGWPVSRMPRERGTLGVRYGFSEATGEFKARGMAALRSTADGAIRLDTGPHEEHKTIRVRILDKEGHVLSESRGPQVSITTPDMQDRIRRARDSLFEQELFYEMTRETRLLRPLGVEINGTTIIVPISSPLPSAKADQTVHIDLVSVSDVSTCTETQPAYALALFVRLLLCHAHRARLATRSELPEPLSLEPKAAKFSSILRPLIAITSHQTATRGLEAYSTSLSSLFRSTKLDVNIRHVDPTGISSETLKSQEGLQALMETATSTAASSLRSKTIFSLQALNAAQQQQQQQIPNFEIEIEIATGAGSYQDGHFAASGPSGWTAGTFGSEAGLHTMFTVTGQGYKTQFEDLDTALACLERLLGRALGLAVVGTFGGQWRFEETRGAAVFTPSGEVEGVKMLKVGFSHVRGPGMVETRCVLDVKGGSGKMSWTSEQDAGQRGLWDVITDAAAL